jgi:hypothetical protein
MEDRRQFLKKTTTITIAGLGKVTGSAGALSAHRASNRTGELAKVLDAEKLKPRGRFYQAVVPDTLDLAERAKLSVRNLTHSVDPEDWYFVYQAINFGPKSPGPDPRSRMSCITPKNARALPWVRTMCGSDEGLEQEYGTMKTLLSCIHEDGLQYCPAESGGAPKDTSYPAIDGILALACENHYALDGNLLWLEYIGLLASGLEKSAIHVEDRAYFPTESSLNTRGEWIWTNRGYATLPYHPPEEPYLEQQGLEGEVKYEQANAIRALVRGYKYGGNKKDLLDLLRMLTRFDLKPGMWENTTLEGYKGNEHGIFAGHFHGNTGSLLSLLDVAEADKNIWLREFVREAYDNAIRNGVVRMGWFPAWITPAKYDRPEASGRHSETCALAEMVELGVRLSDAGMGEYWDDIDAIVRNQFTEQQFWNEEVVRQMSNGAPGIERFVGGFTETPILTAADPVTYGCCSANGAIGLYYAWEGITRFRDGVATVNLFLNRASAWMDVDSHLPYEGKVDLHNKQAQMALVRIPNWVEMDQVRCFVEGKAANPFQSRRYLVFANLHEGETIRLEFPNPKSEEQYTIAGERHKVTFRGSTVVDIEPRAQGPELIPLYQRSHYWAEKAPMRTKRRFVAEKVLPLQ